MITIRAATEKDIPRLLELYAQLSFNPGDYKKAPVADCRKVLRRIKEYPNASLLVAEEDCKVVGTTFMAYCPALPIKPPRFAL
jgi:hypothetical protein